MLLVLLQVSDPRYALLLLSLVRLSLPSPAPPPPLFQFLRISLCDPYTPWYLDPSPFASLRFGHVGAPVIVRSPCLSIPQYQRATPIPFDLSPIVCRSS